MKFKDVRVAEGIKIHDISSEDTRMYVYNEPEENGDGIVEEKIAIHNPIALQVRESGAHIVVSAQGNVHYLRPGWGVIVWTPKEGKNHIDF